MQLWKILKCACLKKCIKVIHSGYVERYQNSLMSSLCRPNIGIKNETTRFTLKSTICIMFTVMHRRQKVLAFEYFQIKSMLWNNKLSRIFYLIGFQTSLFFFPYYLWLLHSSVLPNFATQNFNFHILKFNALQSVTINTSRVLIFQYKVAIKFNSHILYEVVWFSPF